jgi:hypothetical protein
MITTTTMMVTSVPRKAIFIEIMIQGREKDEAMVQCKEKDETMVRGRGEDGSVPVLLQGVLLSTLEHNLSLRPAINGYRFARLQAKIAGSHPRE